MVVLRGFTTGADCTEVRLIYLDTPNGQEIFASQCA